MHIFNDDNTEGILLIDRPSIQLIERLYFRLCYMCSAIFFIICGGELLSKEGIRQNDPTSMGFCSLDITTAIISTRSHFPQQFQCQRGSFCR